MHTLNDETPATAYLWYVLFEDDTFMPIIYSLNKNQSEQDAISQLVNSYETHLDLCVDIEPSTLEVTPSNLCFIKCVVGRVYHTTIAEFTSKTLEFLLNYETVNVHNLTVETKIIHPIAHWMMVPYYIPMKYTKMYSPRFFIPNITCESKYDVLTETIPHYLQVSGIRFPTDPSADTVICGELTMTADVKAFLTKHLPQDLQYVPNAFNVKAYSNEMHSRWSDINEIEKSVKTKHISIIYAFKNVLYVKKITETPGDCDKIRDIFEIMHSPAIFEYTSDDERIHTHIKSCFDKKDILDKKILNDIFVNLEKYISLCTMIRSGEQDKKIYEERVNVKEYMNRYYEITNDVNERIKATDLFNDMIFSPHVSVNENEKLSFRNRLSGYLKEMNVSKKRFSDGFYYYGLKPKETVKMNYSNNSIGLF